MSSNYPPGETGRAYESPVTIRCGLCECRYEVKGWYELGTWYPDDEDAGLTCPHCAWTPLDWAGLDEETEAVEAVQFGIRETVKSIAFELGTCQHSMRHSDIASALSALKRARAMLKSNLSELEPAIDKIVEYDPDRLEP